VFRWCSVREVPIEFVPQQLTSYGGLELFARYFRKLALVVPSVPG